MKMRYLIAFFLILTVSTSFAQFNLWQEFNEFDSYNIDDLFIGKVSGNVYLKPTDLDLHIYSEDNNWLKLTNNLSNISLSDVEELNDGSVLVSSSINGVYKISNGEAVEKNSGMENTKVTAMFVDNNGDIYAGTWFEGGLYKSVDNGENWQLLSLENTDITDFIIHNGTSYVSIDGQGIKESTNNIDWSNSWFGSAFIYKLYLNPKNELLAVSSRGILRLDGDSWVEHNPKLSQINIIDYIETENGTNVFLRSDGKVFRTFDNFENLEELPIIDEETRIFHMALTRNGKLIVGTNNGLFKTKGRIDQKNIYVEHSFVNNDNTADYNDPALLSLNFYNDLGDPIQNYMFNYSDSRIEGQQFEAMTSNTGHSLISIGSPKSL
jgi:hypothetical protein